MFVRSANPIWYLPDLVGNPLNDQYYIFFLTNTFPYVPQNVYEDPFTTNNPWPFPIEFFPNGTLPDNIYFDPNLTYRIEVRQGNTQSSPLIYFIQNYVPDGEPGPIPPGPSTNSNSNQITNPQFAFTSFQGTLTITAAGTYNIAPGWQLTLVGSGTTTVKQLIYSADQVGIGTPPNPIPPYALQINNNGWTSATLFQRFNSKGILFPQSFVSMQVDAFSDESTARDITLQYVPEGQSPIVVVQATLSTSNYTIVQGSAALPPPYTNSNLNNVSYVDMQILLPPTGTVDISDVQMIGQDTATMVSFQDETIERQTDHLFHYYANSILILPKKNILCGWTFPQNPYQFTNSTLSTISAQCSYVADQTIFFQNAASQLQVGQAPLAQRQCLEIKAVTSATETRFALIQYIDPTTIQPYWSYILSSLVRARINSSTQVRIKMRLIWRTSLPSDIGNTEPIASWASNADPVFSAGWTAISPLNDPAYFLQNNADPIQGTGTFPTYSFDQFQLPEDSNADMTLGIVFYTMDNLISSSGNEDVIYIDRISLVPNTFAIDANPVTFDENLRELQFYYEKSYNYNVPVGTVTLNGAIYTPQLVASSVTDTFLYPQEFMINYRQTKRKDPTISFHSPLTGSANNIKIGLRVAMSYPVVVPPGNPIDSPSTNWTQTGNNRFCSLYTPNTSGEFFHSATPLANAFGEAVFHYEATARLGIAE